jgi:hypothetical protein
VPPPDPLIGYIASLCHDLVGREASSSEVMQDPMLLEVACALQQNLRYSPSTSPPGGERYPTSPSYVLVSDLWAERAAHDPGTGDR